MKSNLVAHEESDVSVGAVIGFGVGLVVIGGVIYILLALLFGLFHDARDGAGRPRMYPLCRRSNRSMHAARTSAAGQPAERTWSELRVQRSRGAGQLWMG